MFQSLRSERVRVRTCLDLLAGGFAHMLQIAQKAGRVLLSALGLMARELRECLRLDWAILAVVAVFAIALVPIIPHATRDAQLLTCCFDDEAPLTMALDGMRVWPFGDPFNFLQSTLYGTPEVPAYWGKLRWGGFWYYGGTYLDLAFLFYWPLSLLGVPAFPTAPIILRTVSFVMALAAVIITYNFGRRYAGRIVGILGALFLITDTYFVGYAAHIHPDTTELVLGLLALAVAARHTQQGDFASLVVVAALIGFAQGAKFGGAWLVPMVVLGAIVGLRRAQPALRPALIIRQLGTRGVVAVLVAMVAFAISTPYAFIKPDYFIILNAIYHNIRASSMLPVHFSTWLTSLWDYQGALVLLAAITGAVPLCIQALRGTPRWPMLLATALGATQLVWFSYMGRSWVVLGYMIGLFAIIGLLLGELAANSYHMLMRVSRVGAFAITTVVILVIVIGRWWGLAGLALEYRVVDSRTLIRIAKWAEAGNIPREARLLWDDSVYFDAAKFPNGKMNGHLISYNEVYAARPEYLILSSHMYDAPHYAAMRKNQTYTMQNEGPYSLRLYQDLLATDEPGKTNVPGIEYLRRFSAEPDRSEDCPNRAGGAPYHPWLSDSMLEPVQQLLGNGAAGAWFASEVYLVNTAGRYIDGLRGSVCFTTGPTLRLYKVHQPGTLTGFSQPFASSETPGFPALAAFDGEPSVWKPAPGQSSYAYVGFDFGFGGAKEFTRVRVEWGQQPPADTELEIQFADFGQEWHSAGVFKLTSVAGRDKTFYLLPEGLGAHRFWRMAIHTSVDSEIAVREVRFVADPPSAAAVDSANTNNDVEPQ